MPHCYLYVLIELSDDDCPPEEVLRDCGHNLTHPLVRDWDLCRVVDWHHQLCLELRLELADGADAAVLVPELVLSLSHPALAGYRIVHWQAAAV